MIAIKRLFLILTIFASPLAAQTPRIYPTSAIVSIEAAPQTAQQGQAIQCAQLSPGGAGAYPSPQAIYSIGFTSQANATWLLEVAPSATLTENGNPWGTNIAPGLFIAPTLGAAESIQIAYNGTQYTDARLCEYPGQLTLNVAAQTLTGTSQVAASNMLQANAGDIVIAYGWQTTSNLVTETPAAGFALEPGTVGMYMEDETAAAAGSVTGGVQWSGVVNWTSGIVALKQSVQNVTLTFGPSTSTLTPCTNTVANDDGSSLFNGQRAPESVMQFENGSWVNIGTPVILPNGQITGSISINPNYTDANGLIELELLVQTLLSIPPAAAIPISPAQLQNGQTGLCGSIIVYKTTCPATVSACTGLKYETFGFTP